MASCAAGPQRTDKNYEQAMREGNYSLIIMEPGDRQETMAVLDVEGDTFELAPEEGSSEKERISGLSSHEAIIRADESLAGSGVMLKAITSEDSGLIIGYEVYSPPSHGPGPPPGPETEAVLLPNLLRIDYTVDRSGRQRVRVLPLPLKDPDMLTPSQ